MPPEKRQAFGQIELGGYRADLPAVTPQTLKAEYDRILRTAAIDVMVQGADAANVAERLLCALEKVPRAPQLFARDCA